MEFAALTAALVVVLLTVLTPVPAGAIDVHDTLMLGRSHGER